MPRGALSADRGGCCAGDRAGECAPATREALCLRSGLKEAHRAYIKVTTMLPHRTGASVRVTAQEAHL